MNKEETKQKTFQGKVISTKMDKTAIVSVQRFIKHEKYKKYLKISKKFKAHDEDNSAVVGTEVTIVETRPMSKDKHFKILK